MKAFLNANIAVIGMSVFFVNSTLAHDRVELNNNQMKFYRTYVTPRRNPEHFLRFNATRTCGKGYNAMTKQHRRNHRFRRAHTHVYPPWTTECQF